MSAAKILVVEDEPSFVEALDVGLSREGFEVFAESDGAAALERFREIEPDLVLLDVMLPGRSGIDICRDIRAESAVPIIMVTAKSSEVDVVVGLEIGADDYVSKPYRLRELTARIRTQLRRTEGVDGADRGERPEAEAVSGEIFAVDGVALDTARHEVTVDGHAVSLPRKEFELLRLLLANAGRVLPRATLIERVWGADYYGDTKTLDVHIKRLRSKVEVDPKHPRRLLTVRGVGYKFER